jgi:DNA-binding MarR family transcriptional regulator
MDPREARRAMDALRRIVRALQSSARRPHGGTGVSGAQLFVLQELAAAGPLSLGELAARTLTRPSAVSEVVRRLERARLVRRTASTEDARRLSIDVTARGRRMAEAAAECVPARLAAALGTLSAAQRRAVAAALEKWADAARLDRAPATMFFEPASRSRSPRATRA